MKRIIISTAIVICCVAQNQLQAARTPLSADSNLEFAVAHSDPSQVQAAIKAGADVNRILALRSGDMSVLDYAKWTIYPKMPTKIKANADKIIDILKAAGAK